MAPAITVPPLPTVPEVSVPELPVDPQVDEVDELPDDGLVVPAAGG